jgi:hypothetical protein
MEPDNSSSFPQVPPTSFYSEPDESNLQPHHISVIYILLLSSTYSYVFLVVLFP